MLHPGQQVRSYWEDEQGLLRYDIGEIIGMQYGASHYYHNEWSYLIRFLMCDSNPSLIGTDNRIYIEESSLVTDDTDLGIGD